MFFRQILKWLFAAVALWALLIPGCLLQTFCARRLWPTSGWLSWFFSTFTFRSNLLLLLLSGP
jgi:hypothetical protein